MRHQQVDLLDPDVQDVLGAVGEHLVGWYAALGDSRTLPADPSDLSSFR